MPARASQRQSDWHRQRFRANIWLTRAINTRAQRITLKLNHLFSLVIFIKERRIQLRTSTLFAFPTTRTDRISPDGNARAFLVRKSSGARSASIQRVRHSNSHPDPIEPHPVCHFSTAY